MIEPNHYKNYIGAYGKRFYAPFKKERIHKIDGFRDDFRKISSPEGNEWYIAEFHFLGDPDDTWHDCEDTCIITNEMPILVIDWVVNVNDKEYTKDMYNPYKDEDRN